MDAPIWWSMAAWHGDRWTAAGPRPMGTMGPVDLLVLFVGLFLVVHVGAGPDDRLDQVHADRGTGPGSIGELAAGLLPDEAADVREDHDHLVAVRPHAERGRQDLYEPLQGGQH